MLNLDKLAAIKHRKDAVRHTRHAARLRPGIKKDFHKHLARDHAAAAVKHEVASKGETKKYHAKQVELHTQLAHHEDKSKNSSGLLKMFHDARSKYHRGEAVEHQDKI